MTAAPRFSNLQDWLAWQETLHPKSIDLGLERVARVGQRLACRRPAPTVISVAGTNGKGSCVALFEAILLCAGYRVGAYTSPHLFCYNERIRLDGAQVDDAELCAAFTRVDRARGDETLTYFEFGTLAALDIMTRHRLDVAVLEVGLGGRLDAVNLVDADAALITSIGIDHTDWLGPDRESIGREKAGIVRAGRPAVCGDSDPPASVLEAAGQTGAELAVAGRDFSFSAGSHGWSWQGRGSRMENLPRPALPGAHQLANAAGVLSVLEALQPRLPVTPGAVAGGLRSVRLSGRIEHISGPVDQVLDVSHNAQSAQALADELQHRPVGHGRCYAVLGMMKDKDPASFVQPLSPFVDVWYATSLQVQRAGTAEAIAAAIRGPDVARSVVCSASMQDTLAALQAVVGPGDRVLVCGSFYTVAEWSALQPDFDREAR
jgi:dihydrofolate synthase / folylpolyglutamate synthase